MFCEFLICQYNKNHHDDQSQVEECSQFYYSTEFAQNERRIPHDRGGLTGENLARKLFQTELKLKSILKLLQIIEKFVNSR